MACEQDCTRHWGGSGGIGREICKRLAADGCTVYVGYANGKERAWDVVDEIGGAPHEDLDGLDDDLIDQIFRVNWRGPFATIRSMESLLREATEPVVVNISSIAGVTGVGSNVAYCASKAALDSMTRSLARSLAPAIRVVSVSPGWVEGEYAAAMDPAMLQAQRDATPLGTLASGADVAAAVSAVVNHLPLTTGSIIPVDGGRPLGT